MTTIIISLAFGLAAGCLVNFAVAFKTGKVRNIGICMLGALVGGALIPWALSASTALAAVVGSVVGLGVLSVLWSRFAIHSTGDKPH